MHPGSLKHQNRLDIGIKYDAGSTAGQIKMNHGRKTKKMAKRLKDIT